jgi:hypothetical protein
MPGVNPNLSVYAETSTVPVLQVLAGAFILILFAYILKALEYVIFTLKI